MSKITSVVLGVLLFCLTVVSGYLGLQYAALQTAWQQSQQNGSTFAEDISIWQRDLDALRKTTEAQQATIENLENQLRGELARLETDLQKNYLPKNPNPTLAEKIYDYNEATLTSQAKVQALQTWLTDNRFYLEEILQQSLSLKNETPAIRGVLIDKVLPDSIFAQMGLKDGDRILSINGSPVTRNLNLSKKLLEPQNNKIVLQRNNQTLNLALQYTDTNNALASENTNSTTETTAVAPKIQVSNTQYQNQQAVKVVQVGNSNVKNPLKPDDVILSVNGQDVSNAETFYDAVQNSESANVSLGIVRDGQTQEVDVAFSEK